METLIPIYAELKRPMPAWITSIYKEDEQFNEIAQGFIQCLSLFIKKMNNSTKSHKASFNAYPN